MKTAVVRLFAVLAFVCVVLPVQARESVPIVDFDEIVVLTGSGKIASADQVRGAITAAAQSRNWQVDRAPSGNALQATLQVRGKHTVVVEINYSEKMYSIKYQGSTNMKYAHAPDTNVRVIHPFYNRWVSDLREAIRLELSKL